MDSCSVNLNNIVKNSKFYTAMEKQLGSDNLKLVSTIIQVTNNGDFNPGFRKWYYNNNKKALRDLNNIPENIAEMVIEYCNRLHPDGNDSVMKEFKIEAANYTSISARNYCLEDARSSLLRQNFLFDNKINPGKKPVTFHDWKHHLIKDYINQLIIRILNDYNLTQTDLKTKVSKNRVKELYEWLISDEAESPHLSKDVAKNMATLMEYVNICKDILGERIDVMQNKNLLALIDEMTDFHRLDDGTIANDKFFDELFDTAKIRKLINKNDVVDEDLAKESSAIAVDEGVDVEEGTIALELTFDETMKDYDNHSGEYGTFMLHLSDNLISYFESLPKLLSTKKLANGKYDYDFSNPLGFAEFMTSKSIAHILYSNAKTTGNIEEFIESIKDIAEQLPGYEGLIQLYYDLKGYEKTIVNENGEEVVQHVPPMYAFAEELYKTFSKIVTTKKEIVIRDDNQLEVRLSNTEASTLDSLQLLYLNQIRWGSAKTSPIQAWDELTKVNKNIQELKKLKGITGKSEIDLKRNAIRRSIIDRLTTVFKWYIPDISLSAILNFVDNHETVVLENHNRVRKVDDIANIDILYGRLSNLIQQAQKAREKYEKIIQEAESAKTYNKNLTNNIVLGETEKLGEQKDIAAIYNSYMTGDEYNGLKSAVMSLAELLVDYTVVISKFNSRNAEGNMSSDILNNNFIGYLQKMLNREGEPRTNRDGSRREGLSNYAKYKFGDGLSQQYDFSNILIEHTEGDVVVNYGLFKKTQHPLTGEMVYVPTKYASELLKFTLFNGTADYVKQKASLYAKMSRGDYLISALLSFFDSPYANTFNSKNTQFQLADYFLRTPSDASKNYSITMPRYSYLDPTTHRGIFIISDEEQQKISQDVTQRLENIPVTQDNFNTKSYRKLSIIDLAKIITNTYKRKRIYLQQGQYSKSTTEAGKGYAVLAFEDANGQKIAIAVKGDINDAGKTYIENFEFQSIIQNETYKSDYSILLNEVGQYYQQQLEHVLMPLLNGEYIQRNINRHHILFKQFYNVAFQEIVNAAIAAKTLFKSNETQNGEVKELTFVDENLELNWTDEFEQSGDPDNMCEANYHHRSAKDLREDGSDPEANYSGNKVFYKDSNGVIKLSGKVFSSDRFTNFDETEGENVNYLAELFADGPAEREDGRIHLLYGGFNTGLHMDAAGNVVLTDAQKKYVSNAIAKFLTDYVNRNYQKVQQYSEILSDREKEFTYEQIAEFTLNYRLAYYASADLLEGDSKCYKSFVDFLKRAKEVQGAGIPYAALDYGRIPNRSRELLKYNSLNENAEIQQLIAEGKLNDARAYSSFRGITVKNTVRGIEGSKTWIKQHLIAVMEKSYTDNNMKVDKERVQQMADNMMQGMDYVKANDAQSYITFEEWIRRIALKGQLPKYLPLIQRICDESKPLLVEDIEEFVQVQKNFYYDQYYDKTLKHMRPRQIKNAEFVLVPRLVRGTQLEKVYQTMRKFGIDQLNTVEASKAGKANILTLWDNNGDLNSMWFTDSDTDKSAISRAVELFDYNFLYSQQETKQHVNDENKAAIQLMKRVIDNIPHYLMDGKEHPLWKVKQKFQKLYAANIRESNFGLLERLNVKYDRNDGFSISDADGVVGLDVEVLCTMLKDELFRLNLDNDMLDFVTLNQTPVEELLTGNGFGLDTSMPIIANNSIRMKFENIVQSLFNHHITRQTLPGFHAAQITGVGWRNEGKVRYKLNEENSELASEISYKEYKALSYEDKLKYTPVNGIGISRDLAYKPALYKHNDNDTIITEHDYLELDDKAKKNYKLQGAATYIEVRVPKSIFNLSYRNKDKSLKSDEQLLQELKLAGLDEFVGYRIPTEGKQSVAIMKVVGFIDDAYGSTIVVPDGWVAQTGSDFDIDTVYAVVKNNRLNKLTNRIEAVKYKTKFDKNDYIKYVRTHSNNKVSKRGNIQEKKQALIDRIKSDRTTEFNAIMDEETAIYDQLPEEVQKIIKVAQQVSKKGKTNAEHIMAQKEAVIQKLSEYNTTDDNTKILINDLIDISKQIIEFVKDDSFIEDINDVTDVLKENQFKEIEEKAQALGLPSFEEFLQLSTEEKNTREARNNELISAMMTILKSNYSMEENLSQSNFREIIRARDEVNSKANINRKQSRSPYDFVDQADNMEEAISGRALKGISVAYDNLVSIMNTVHPILSESASITIAYPINKTYKNGKTITLNTEQLKQRFNTYERLSDSQQKLIKENVRVDEEAGLVYITHDKFGWTNDNRNIDDFIITAYGSQTTAHQLDVIKEGAVPNVNDFTFGVYKLFPSIGSDYDTSIAFMTQPGVTMIANNYNNSESIYAKRYTDPIRTAVIALAQKLNPGIQYYNEAERLLNKELKKHKIDTMNVLNYNRLVNRLDEHSKHIDNVLFDYLVVKKFKDLQDIGDKINQYGFVINPDKYGAKQTIYATNEILSRMREIMTDDLQVFETVNNAKNEKVHVLEAIFPGISTTMREDSNLDSYMLESDDAASVYPSLHTFFKYSTIPSILVNKRLFQTQHPAFRQIIESIIPKFSGKTKRLSEKTEDSFTAYILSYLHNNIPIIKNRVGFDLETKNFKINKQISEVLERSRISGFYETNQGANLKVFKAGTWVDFSCVDITKPTKEEIALFGTFSPAQKVVFIQENFSDPLFAKYLRASLLTHVKYDRRNANGQSILFNEESEDINNVREEFRKMFMNENPLLRMTALDLIKYAYVVEGRSRARNTVGKAIPNSILLESLDTNGTGIVDRLKEEWNTLLQGINDDFLNYITEAYLRSHPTTPEITQAYLSETEFKKHIKAEGLDKMMVISINSENKDFLLNKGIVYEEITIDDEGNKKQILVPNSYVNITRNIKGQQVSTLYKIETGPTMAQAFVLTPLNKLEPNEFFKIISSNSENNMPGVKTPIFYKNVVRLWREQATGASLMEFYNRTVTEEQKQAAEPANITLLGSEGRTIKDVLPNNRESTKRLVDIINTHFTGFVTEPVAIADNQLTSLIDRKSSKYIYVNEVPYSVKRLDSKIFLDMLKEEQDKGIKPSESTPVGRIYNRVREYGESQFDNLFLIEPVLVSNDLVSKSSTIVESSLLGLSQQAEKLVRKLATEGDIDSMQMKEQFDSNNANIDELTQEDRLKNSLIYAKEWVEREVENLINGSATRSGLNLFYLDNETGKYLKMTDSKIFTLMLSDPELHRKYLKTLLDANRLLDTFEAFAAIPYEENDPELKLYVEKINKAIDRLRNNRIYKEAERLYVTEHLAKVSKNPNIQSNIISLLDGYHRTSWLEANIHDLQDTKNPIIQIITKEVMADIRAKEMQAEEDLRAFDKQANEIMARAKQAGLPIDFDKIIDSKGNWITDHTEELRTKLYELYKGTKDAYQQFTAALENKNLSRYELSKYYERYLEAKDKEDKFLLHNIHREVTDDYYYLEQFYKDGMKDKNGRFYAIYVYYNMLSDIKRKLQKHVDSEGLIDDAITKQIEELDNEIKSLTSLVVLDPVTDLFIPNFEESVRYTGNPETDRQLSLKDSKIVNEFLNYLNTMKKLNEKYFEFVEKESFQEVLKLHLDIIESKEQRDYRGIPTKSDLELSLDEEYMKSKRWINEHTTKRFGLSGAQYNAVKQMSNKQVYDEVKKIFDNPELMKKDYLRTATLVFEYLKRREALAGNKKKNEIFKALIEEKNARDKDGIVDARKFSQTNIRQIKIEQQRTYGILEGSEYNIRSILKNDHHQNDLIFNKLFYQNLISDGVSNEEYIVVVNQINDILRKAYMHEAKEIRTASMLNIDDLTNLTKLVLRLKYGLSEDVVKDISADTLLQYAELAALSEENTPIKAKINQSKENAKKIKSFIKKNTTQEISDRDKATFDSEYLYAKQKGGLFLQLWEFLNVDEITIDDAGVETATPHYMFWGYLRPKDELMDKYVDKQMTAALRVLPTIYYTTNSKYYEMERTRMISEYGVHSEEFKQWYVDNHIYNPRTNEFEPLQCWRVRNRINPSIHDYKANYKMSTRQVIANKVNPKFKKGFGYAGNYKGKNNRADYKNPNIKYEDVNPDGTYDSNTTLTAHEEEMKNFMQQTLLSHAKTESAKNYLSRRAPVKAKKSDNSSWLYELAKTFGVVASDGTVYWNGDNNIGYNTDFIPPMPMMETLKNKDSVTPPVRERFKTEAEYESALKEYNEHKDEIRQKNEEIHKELMDRNWISVMKEFIRQAGHYNAIQDNKYRLFFGQKLLQDVKTYVPRSDNHSKLKRMAMGIDDTQQSFVKRTDENLIEQYNNWLHRLIYNHYKMSQGVQEKIGNVLQGFTSASYMTLNARAGIANVLIGDTNILGEAFAKEYFGFKEWGLSKKLWGKGIMDYLAHAYDDKADTKVGAIIKGMHVVDYSEVNGRITQLDMKKWSQIVTDIGFSFNNIGEHLMQNGAMFAMMLSHKVMENPNYGKPGEKAYVIMNFEEYALDAREKVFEEIADDKLKQEYRKYVDQIKKDPEQAKEIARFRSDALTKFMALNFTKEQRKEFRKKVEDRREDVRKTFDQAKTVYDQLDISNDGYMVFAAGSIFETLNNKKNADGISEAYQLLGAFKGRVISVNKKIHGNYGKLDSAKIEKFWMGRLLMQYHKHIPVGIAKHYRREGYYNEERGTVEKGKYVSLKDFLMFPVELARMKGDITQDEATAVNGLKNLFTGITSFVQYMAVYNDLMPEYERANLRRLLANACAVLFAVAGAVLVKIAWDDDEEEDSIACNLLLYEMDRLASEAVMWNPVGAFAEFKKQWSSPVAAGSIISDVMKTMQTIGGIVLDKTGLIEYNPYYETGRFSGKHKLGVYIERRIPYYRNYAILRDITESNKYYKVGENVFSFIDLDKLEEMLTDN